MIGNKQGATAGLLGLPQTQKSQFDRPTAGEGSSKVAANLNTSGFGASLKQALQKQKPLMQDSVGQKAQGTPAVRESQWMASEFTSSVSNAEPKLQDMLIPPDKQLMNDFLTQLEEELQINPEIFVRAFAQLDEETLQMPPQATIDQVIEALDVEGGQKEDLKEIYTAMLAQMEEQENKFAQEGIVASFQVVNPVDLVSQQSAVVNTQPQDVLKSQAASWNKWAQPGQQPGAQPQPQVNPLTAGETVRVNSGDLNNSQDKALTPDSQGTISLDAKHFKPVNEKESAQLLKQSLQNMDLSKSDFTMRSQGNEEALPDPGTEKLGPGTKPLALDSNQALDFQEPIQIQTTNDSVKNADAQTFHLGTNAAAPLASEQQSGLFSESEDNTQEFATAEQVTTERTVNEGATPKVPGFGDKLSQTATLEGRGPQIENLDEVIQQARYIARNGGGEIKIQLTPEGLGQVDLKVAVSDGVIQVELLTENVEAKKILESGLDGLKQSLSANKMNVDFIKVDVSQNLQNELNQQGSQQDAEQARQFLNDFRQDNSARREGMNDFARFSDSVRERSVEKGDQVRAQSDRPKRSGPGRLHVVA